VLDHVGLEVADLAASARFYDAVLYALGARRLHANGAAVAYGTEEPRLWIVAALRASGRAAVVAAWRSGLSAGGRDLGEPGPRPQYGERTYAAYLSDPDGFRVEVVSG